jgi:tryptophan 2,3-dioxygenase
MASEMTYGEYLALDEVLGAQRPLSTHHDELLFIVIHQAKELWLKEMIHELAYAQAQVTAGRLPPAQKALARVSRIQAVMTHSWEVLSTLTPADYLSFRGLLGSSSGFQSAQFREFEYRLGLKDSSFLRYHPEGTAPRLALETALAAPSLYDAALQQLARHGLSVPDAVLNRDVSLPYEPSPAVEDAWLQIYQDTTGRWELYELAEKLVDLDDALLTWRHKHVLTVERIIGRRRGTGGTEGVGYLQSTLVRRCFPELWSVRSRV